MIFTLLRRLFAPSRVAKFEPGAPATSSASREDEERFRALLSDLKRAVPDDLAAAFEEAVRSCPGEPLDGAQLLDAIDSMRCNLGIAIGRGAIGQDKRYEELGRVVTWLYGELGQPQDTGYAVLVRAARALEARDREQRCGPDRGRAG